MHRVRINRIGREGKRSARALGLDQRRGQMLVMDLRSNDPPKWVDARAAWRYMVKPWLAGGGES